MPLRIRLLCGLFLLGALLAVDLWLAQHLPATGWVFSTADQQLLAAPDAATPPAAVSGFRAGDRHWPADALLLIEEPDQLPDHAAVNAFVQRQGELAAAARAGELVMEFADGRSARLDVRTRTLGELPGMFWLQLGCATVGLGISLLVLAAQPAATVTRLFALTGAAYMTFTAAAAVYSTRELLIDAGLLAALMRINYAGALFFSASVMALLWNYPLRLGGRTAIALAYGAFAAGWLAGVLQLMPLAATHATVLSVYLVGLAGAALQWWRTRGRPFERATLRWILLSTCAGTLLFAGFIILPTALNLPTVASQGVMFCTFLLMYIGMALGVTRYRLFELERWWFSIWAWFFGGLAVLVVDLLLVGTLALSQGAALGLALALVGWLYFPLRQWVWERWAVRRRGPLDNWLEKALPLALGLSDQSELRPALIGMGTAVFAPLHWREETAALPRPAVRDNGLALALPLYGGGRLVLEHADGGARLFTARDVQAATALLALHRLAADILRAREQGARAERDRLRGDLHDDLGAKLLTLLHRSQDGQRELVREAIRDLRELLASMEHAPQSLAAALADWRQEIEERCHAAGTSLHWRLRGAAAGELDPRSHQSVARILREGVSNALRHAAPRQLEIDIAIAEHRLTLQIANDGDFPTLADWRPGRGCQIMRSRAELLGGTLVWHSDDRWRVRAELPLAPADTPLADAVTAD